MTTGQVDWYQMGCLTILNLLLSSFNDIYKYFAGRPDADAEVRYRSHKIGQPAG